MKVERSLALHSVSDYESHVVCSLHNTMIFKLVRKYSMQDQVCVIPKCKGRNCRQVRIPIDKSDEEYVRMTDSYACIMMTIEHTVTEIRSSLDEDVDLEKLRGEPLCPKHRWVLTRGEQRGSALIRPVADQGICTLPTIAERKTARWVREMIFRNNTIVCGNIVFTRDVYRHYMNLCHAMKKTTKTERYIISRIANALSFFRIFLKTGKELGRGKTFFYNANRVIIHVGLKEHLRLSKGMFSITCVKDEDAKIRELANMFRDRHKYYEKGVIDVLREVERIDQRFYTTAALRMSCVHFLRLHRLKCRRKGEGVSENCWPISNRNIPDREDMSSSDLRFGLRVLGLLEKTVYTRYENCQGPLTTLLGMAAILGCTTKLHYVMNRLAMIQSYETVDRLRKRLCTERNADPKGMLGALKKHELAVFSIDNLDQTNKHGILVGGKADYGMHLTAIQGVFCNTEYSLPSNDFQLETDFDRHLRMTSATEFIDGFVPSHDDIYLSTSVELFVVVVYQHQSKLTASDPVNVVSVSKLVTSMFEGYRTLCDIRYVDVLNENAALPSAIHKSMDIILENYGRERSIVGGHTVLAGDQPTFKMLFKSYYDGLELNFNDSHRWMVPIPGGFHNDKTGLVDILKRTMEGTGMESFLDDGGFSETQIEGFMSYGHARRNRLFLFQLAAASVIKLCDTILMSDPSLIDEIEALTAPTRERK